MRVHGASNVVVYNNNVHVPVEESNCGVEEDSGGGGVEEHFGTACADVGAAGAEADLCTACADVGAAGAEPDEAFLPIIKNKTNICMS